MPGDVQVDETFLGIVNQMGSQTPCPPFHNAQVAYEPLGYRKIQHRPFSNVTPA
jgi:hypothetical protein